MHRDNGTTFVSTHDFATGTARGRRGVHTTPTAVPDPKFETTKPVAPFLGRSRADSRRRSTRRRRLAAILSYSGALSSAFATPQCRHRRGLAFTKLPLRSLEWQLEARGALKCRVSSYESRVHRAPGLTRRALPLQAEYPSVRSGLLFWGSSFNDGCVEMPSVTGTGRSGKLAHGC